MNESFNSLRQHSLDFLRLAVNVGHPRRRFAASLPLLRDRVGARQLSIVDPADVREEIDEHRRHVQAPRILGRSAKNANITNCTQNHKHNRTGNQTETYDGNCASLHQLRRGSPAG